jgi:hypothetical protein
MRRPSPALIVALVALFVALGGPAGAASLIRGSQIKKNSITSKQIKNRSLATKDLSRRAVRALESTPNGSITEAKLANLAVTSGKLGGAAVTAAKMAADSVGPIQLQSNAVTGAKVADGSLTAADIAAFSGQFAIAVTTPIAPHTCQSFEPRGLAPEIAHANISGDIVDIAPDAAWDDRRLVLSRRNSSTSVSRFVVSICNVSSSTTPAPAGTYRFRYIVFQLP